MKRFGILICCLILMLCGCTAMGRKTVETKPIYDLSLLDQNGNQVTLSDYKGKTIYVDFWASWCRPCLETMPLLNELSVKNDDYVILTIVQPDKSGEKSKDEFLKWFKEQSFSKNVTVLFDDKDVFKKYNVKGFPYAVVINKEFTDYKTYLGYNSKENILKHIEEVD